MAVSTKPSAEPNLVEQYLEEARRVEEMRRAKKKFRNVEAFPFWPHEAVRGLAIILIFSAAVMFCSALMPYFLEKPANPAGQPEVILPDWYLLWSYGLLKPGIANGLTIDGTGIELPILGPLNAKGMGILLNIIITIPLVAIPFISTGNPRRPQEAPWMASFGVAGIVFVFNASVYSANSLIYIKNSLVWWGDSLLKLTPIVGHAGKAAAASAMSVVGSLAFWVLPLPILSYLVRRYVLHEPAKLAAQVTVVSTIILVLIVAYGNGLDPVLFVKNPLQFFAVALANTNLLAWISWWTTLLAFEVCYWGLVAWKQWAERADHYEHGLNLTYYKVR